MRSVARADLLPERETPATFEEVFAAHAPYVARTLRCLGVREHELDDACQEVFVVVHRRLAEVGPRSVRSWLYGICLRKALAARRLAARAKSSPAEATAAVEPDQEASVVRRQRLERALAILDSLSDPERAVFVLFEVEQLSMAEIAGLLGCPLQTAYARLYAARRHVEAALRRLTARKDLP